MEKQPAVHLYKNHIDRLSELSGENTLAFRILLFFIKHMDDNNKLAVSNETMQRIFERSRPTIYRAIRHLKDNGWITIEKAGASNIHIVNKNVARAATINEFI